MLFARWRGACELRTWSRRSPGLPPGSIAARRHQGKIPTPWPQTAPNRAQSSPAPRKSQTRRPALPQQSGRALHQQSGRMRRPHDEERSQFHGRERPSSMIGPEMGLPSRRLRASQFEGTPCRTPPRHGFLFPTHAKMAPSLQQTCASGCALKTSGRRDLLTTGPGPDAGGSKPGKEGCDHMPEKSGMGTALCVPKLAGAAAGATCCAEAGATTAANVTSKSKCRCTIISTSP
jgi:hypothetical protein